jgi:putative hydrolase of the HAD superfamily
MALAAVLFDLGDCIMREATEEKLDGVTQRAELVPGMAELLHSLRRQGQRLGLVADTRIGTYQNVLRQHGLYDVFDAFAVSEEVGAEKPDWRMFVHALEALAIPEPDWGRVAMIGNNLARDIRGANALGLISIWMVWNPDYPTVPAGPEETPAYQVGTAAELGGLLAALDGEGDPAAHTHPRPFPWRTDGLE